LQQNYGKIQSAGLGLAAVSYDSPEILNNFAKRMNIAFPLLSDPKSEIIRAYGILNTSVKPDSPVYGIPNPGIYWLDKRDVVKAKYFEDDYRERQTSAALLLREFGIEPAAPHASVTAKHLSLSTSASTGSAHMGHHISLLVDVDLPARVHVYAPGVKGYIPIDWKHTDTPAAKAAAVSFPAAKTMRLEAIQETVPVYQGHFRLTTEVTLGNDKDLAAAADKDGSITLQGTLRYQACDDEKCFLPENVPLAWTLHFEPLDRVRVPQEMQRGAKGK
jgi:hypothetical protein